MQVAVSDVDHTIAISLRAEPAGGGVEAILLHQDWVPYERLLPDNIEAACNNLRLYR